MADAGMERLGKEIAGSGGVVIAYGDPRELSDVRANGLRQADVTYGVVHVTASGQELEKSAGQLDHVVRARCETALKAWDASAAIPRAMNAGRKP